MGRTVPPPGRASGRAGLGISVSPCGRARHSAHVPAELAGAHVEMAVRWHLRHAYGVAAAGRPRLGGRGAAAKVPVGRVQRPRPAEERGWVLVLVGEVRAPHGKEHVKKGHGHAITAFGHEILRQKYTATYGGMLLWAALPPTLTSFPSLPLGAYPYPPCANALFPRSPTMSMSADGLWL